MTEKREVVPRNLTQGAFSDKVNPDSFDGFTDESVVQCDVQVVENTFIDDSK